MMDAFLIELNFSLTSWQSPLATTTSHHNHHVSYKFCDSGENYSRILHESPPNICVETCSQHPDIHTVVKTLILAINHCNDGFAERIAMKFHVKASPRPHNSPKIYYPSALPQNISAFISLFWSASTWHAANESMASRPQTRH